MIHILPFRPEHLAEITPQASQPQAALTDLVARGRQLSATGTCFTAYSRAEEAMLFCGGALESHAQHATMWAMFAEGAAARLREMAAIRRATRVLIGKLPHRRIDALVRSEHRAGHCWINALGFVAEGRMLDYFEDGGDAVIYRYAR